MKFGLAVVYSCVLLLVSKLLTLISPFCLSNYVSFETCTSCACLNVLRHAATRLHRLRLVCAVDPNRAPPKYDRSTRLLLCDCSNFWDSNTLPLLELSTKAASQHFRLCIVEMHSRKLRHDDTSAKNVTQYVGYALASQRLK